MHDHEPPRPFISAIKQALKQPKLWALRDREVERAGLRIGETTQHEWQATINGVHVRIVWLRFGDGFGMEDGKELDLYLAEERITLFGYEFDKLFAACQGLQRHFYMRYKKDRDAKLRGAMDRLADTLSKPNPEESTSHDDQAVP